MNKNVSILVIVGAILLVFITVFGVMWAGAYNGAIQRQNDVSAKKQAIYAAYTNRYEKVAAYIDAIQSADNQIMTQIEAITEAREAFANAMGNGNLDLAEGAASTIESTFINLISYMEDNPSNWNTIGLTAGFMSEFSASTNAVTFSINTYNQAVTDYNTHIQLFPNNLFTASFSINEDLYTAPNFNTDLPTFNG